MLSEGDRVETGSDAEGGLGRSRGGDAALGSSLARAEAALRRREILVVNNLEHRGH